MPATKNQNALVRIASDAVKPVCVFSGLWEAEPYSSDDGRVGVLRVGEDRGDVALGETLEEVVTSGLSKAFALPGLRIGWIVSKPSMIRTLCEYHDYLTLTPSYKNTFLEPNQRRANQTSNRSLKKPYRNLHPKPDSISS